MKKSRRQFIQYSSLGVASLLYTPWSKASTFSKMLSTGGFETLRSNVGYFTGREAER